MNLPEPYASASTPRTDAIDSQGKPENMTFTEWVNLLHTSHKQLERENLWLREVVEKQNKALELLKASCKDVLLPFINEAIHNGLKLETWAPEQMQWSESVAETDKALSACNQLQQYLKDL